MPKTRRASGFIHLPGFKGAVCNVAIPPRETSADKTKVTCPECLEFHRAAIERARARVAERTNMEGSKMAARKKKTAAIEENKPEQQKADTGGSDHKTAASDLDRAKEVAAEAVRKDHFANDDQIRAAVEQAGYGIEGLDPAVLGEIREGCGVKVIKPSGWVSEQIDGEWRKTGRRLNERETKAVPTGKRRGRPPGSGRKSAAQVQAQATTGLVKQGDPFALARLVSEIQAIMAAHGVSKVTIPRQGMIVTR